MEECRSRHFLSCLRRYTIPIPSKVSANSFFKYGSELKELRLPLLEGIGRAYVLASQNVAKKV